MLGSNEPVGRLIGVGDRRGLVLGGGLVAALVVLGTIVGESYVPVLSLMIGVFVACAAARPPAVVLVGGITLVGVLVLVAVYHFDPVQVALRLAAVAAATAMACYLSWDRGRRDQTAELLLERNELALQFELLLREAPVGFLLLDNDLRCLVVNEKLASLRDIPVESFLGRRLTEVPGTSGASVDLENVMAGVLFSGAPVLGLALADGEPDHDGTREFEANVFPVSDPATTSVVGVGVTVEEVTERNRTARYTEQLLHERDRVARALQESLLPPSLPEPPSLAFAATYLPAGTGADLGGDFYDVFETVDDCWHVVLGDICGKGIPAATQIGLARHTVRAACVDHPEPGPTLELLNEVLYRQADADRFLTAVHLVIDLTHGVPTCTAALGGHPPPLLVRRGEVREVGTYGPLLGIHAEVEVPQSKLDLEPGDLVIAYTDGLIEDRQGRFDERDLRDFLKRAADAPPAEVITGLERTLAEHRPGPPADDVAIVAIRVAP